MPYVVVLARGRAVVVAFGVEWFGFDQVTQERGDELGRGVIAERGLPLDVVQVAVGADDPQRPAWDEGIACVPQLMTVSGTRSG
jgi:hypothetical protein